MEVMELTERQQRELEYYNTYSDLNSKYEVDFEPVMGRVKRPWNSYWYAAELAVNHFHSRQQRLLDFGCGNGYYAMQYARIGYQVYGFDLSPNNILHAQQMAEFFQFSDRTHFATGVAEKLNFPDGFFDIIVGIDILHHVEIKQAIQECARVLKPGGIAIFHEPVRAPIFDTLRESKLAVRMVPNTVSFERHITEDERKLDAADLEAIKKLDPDPIIRHFLLFSRLERFSRKHQGALEKFDSYFFRIFPVARRFGGRIVMTLRK